MASLHGGWVGALRIAAGDGSRVMCTVNVANMSGSTERVATFTYAISTGPRDPELGTGFDYGVEPGDFTVIISHTEFQSGDAPSDDVTVTVNDGDKATGAANPSYAGHSRYAPVFAYSLDHRTVRISATVLVGPDFMTPIPDPSWETVTAAVRCPHPMPGPRW